MPSPTLVAAVRHVIANQQDAVTAQELGIDLGELREALVRLENVDPPVVEGATPSDYLGPACFWVSRHENVGDAVASYLSARGEAVDVSVSDFLSRGE